MLTCANLVCCKPLNVYKCYTHITHDTCSVVASLHFQAHVNSSLITTKEMSVELANFLTEFIACSIHSILYVRGIYPAVLFEQRMYLGVSVWQSRHPEIITYIRRVIDNMRPLLKVNAVERIVFATVSSAGVPIDHVSIKCRPILKTTQTQMLDDEDAQWQAQPSSDDEFATLQEELRSAILKVGLLDTQLPKLPEDCTWSVMVITNKDSATQKEGESALQAALTSGEWYIDNNQSTEQLSLAQRVSTTSTAGNPPGTSARSSNPEEAMDVDSQELPVYSHRSPKLVPIKSFQNELVNFSVYAHVFR